MKTLAKLILPCILLCLLACSPIKPAVSYQYKLGSFSGKQLATRASQHSILITQPEAVAGYQTEQMLYVKKTFEISSFANNAWISAPADMLFPLILQSIQRSGYFYAVASSPTSDQTDYRLDTQLIELQQNFLQHPSEIRLTVKVVLTHVSDNRVIASRVISQRIPCPMDTPYGGVIAANQAAERFTAELTRFVVSELKRG
ncbi:ABC-type transport auxiliary lipoprotein family protein [Legionella sp. CNM-4043-24]|uniref:ABC-type transport auxiliary lipoprotein family protein n=1 Tax=Legionella sp. CNM-4043-24 TaxID=3421646 RepID=UPI00403AA17E